MTNIHKLKHKRKNISKELGKLYTKKRSLLVQIGNMEEAKLNNKIAINREKEKKELRKKNKK